MVWCGIQGLPSCNIAVLAGSSSICYLLLRMKRTLAVIAASAYLSFSHYCLSYAVVTGQAHCPPPAGAKTHAAEHHHEAEHDGTESHDHAGAQHDHPSDRSETCCTSHDSAALTNAVPAQNVDYRALGVVFQTILSAQPQVVLARIYSYPNKHGPPGRPEQKAYPPQLTSRPPPFLASL